MRRRCKFEYGSQSFTAEFPAMPWVPSDSTIGGSRTSAAGIPASYVVRRDALIDITLRIMEDEWASFLNMLYWGQSAQVLTWYPDALDTGTSFNVYWESPLAGERVAPSRDAEYPRMFTVSITLRGAGSAVPWVPFFADPEE